MSVSVRFKGVKIPPSTSGGREEALLYNSPTAQSKMLDWVNTASEWPCYHITAELTIKGMMDMMMAVAQYKVYDIDVPCS